MVLRIFFTGRKGVDVLSKTFGLVEAGRFISLILRELFDCTEWRQELYRVVSLDEFYNNVQNSKKMPVAPHSV